MLIHNPVLTFTLKTLFFLFHVQIKKERERNQSKCASSFRRSESYLFFCLLLNVHFYWLSLKIFYPVIKWCNEYDKIWFLDWEIMKRISRIWSWGLWNVNSWMSASRKRYKKGSNDVMTPNVNSATKTGSQISRKKIANGRPWSRIDSK